jgi:5-methylthioadenosine/S-adenosylhomocysteine deaminase
MYVGGTITALGCIDAGITCVIDNSHNARSAGHSDAAVEALLDSGIRAGHASGCPQAGEWDRQWPLDLTRLQKKYFSSADQLVTLRMFSAPSRENWAFARSLGLRITTEFQGPQQAALLDSLWADRLVGPDNTFNHCGALPEKTWEILRDSAATVDVCPRSDAQYGLGEGISAYQHALDHRIKPGFSVDNETSYSSDMFMEMRVAFYMQRALAQNRKFEGEQKTPVPVNVRDVLECATVNGANCAGLGGKIGSLTPGKEADIVMIRADDINLYPSNNALGTVVQAADRSNVDTVIIGGRIRKQNGKVVALT